MFLFIQTFSRNEQNYCRFYYTSSVFQRLYRKTPSFKYDKYYRLQNPCSVDMLRKNQKMSMYDLRIIDVFKFLRTWQIVIQLLDVLPNNQYPFFLRFIWLQKLRSFLKSQKGRTSKAIFFREGFIFSVIKKNKTPAHRRT